jgi:prepilin-type N-terminal cleavage/methylation domain-containing protein
MINRFQSQTKGFLLIEVVIALAIFAVATAVISQSFANGLFAKYQREASLDTADKLLFLVDQVFKHIENEKIAKNDSFLSNGGEMHFPDESCWQWKMRCQDTFIMGLFHISLDLTLPSGKEEYQFYRYIKDWIDLEQKTKSKEHFDQKKWKKS